MLVLIFIYIYFCASHTNVNKVNGIDGFWVTVLGDGIANWCEVKWVERNIMSTVFVCGKFIY